MGAKKEKIEEIEITPEMCEAGKQAVISELGGADLGAFFDGADLAKLVYRAMEFARRVSTAECTKRHPSQNL